MNARNFHCGKLLLEKKGTQIKVHTCTLSAEKNDFNNSINNLIQCSSPWLALFNMFTIKINLHCLAHQRQIWVSKIA